MITQARKFFLVKLKQQVKDARRLHELERRIGVRECFGHNLNHRINCVWGFDRVLPRTGHGNDLLFWRYLRTRSAQEFLQNSPEYRAHLQSGAYIVQE